jgi:hypothetical protein
MSMADETQEIVTAGEPISELEAPIEAVPVDLPVEAIPVEVVADPGFWLSSWNGYVFGLEWVFPFMMIIAAYISLRHLIWNSLRFNYLHYIAHGEFVLAWGDDGGNVTKKERREKIAKDIKMHEDDFASWFAALCMSLVAIVVCGLIALAWPITIILVFPLMAVRAIGYRKRRKVAFTQKLKGEHLNESV